MKMKEINWITCEKNIRRLSRVDRIFIRDFAAETMDTDVGRKVTRMITTTLSEPQTMTLKELTMTELGQEYRSHASTSAYGVLVAKEVTSRLDAFLKIHKGA